MTGPEIRRLYYSMREVCRLAQVTPYMLRSWEKKFPIVKPTRTKTGKRLFRPDDLHWILQIAEWKKAGMSEEEIESRLSVQNISPFLQSQTIKSKADLIVEIRKALEEILELLKMHSSE